MRRRETPGDNRSDYSVFPVVPRRPSRNNGDVTDGKKKDASSLQKIEDDALEGLIDWDPFRDMEGLFREMSKVIERFSSSLSDLAIYPKIDISETGDNIVVKAEIPGLSKDSFDVVVHDNHVRLSGRQQRINEYRNIDKNAYRKEESYNAFFRTLPLPSKVKYQQAQVEYKGDILTITVPKDR